MSEEPVRVLVVDDDQLFVRLMTAALTQRGHEVQFALDGASGERLFNSVPFDAVVCDIVMPDQDGVQTIRQVRTKRGDVGIVAISGGLSFSHSSNIDILDVAAKLGADVTLKKPFQMSELVASVDRAIAARGTNASRAQG